MMSAIKHLNRLSESEDECMSGAHVNKKKNG